MMPYRLRVALTKYEIEKRLDRLCLKLATKMPGRLRMWVVVDSANYSIFHLHPRADGYAGPDGLTFNNFMDGAQRRIPHKSEHESDLTTVS